MFLRHMPRVLLRRGFLPRHEQHTWIRASFSSSYSSNSNNNDEHPIRYGLGLLGRTQSAIHNAVMKTGFTKDQHLVHTIARVTTYGGMGLTGVVVMTNLGLDLSALGLTGITAGFVLKDVAHDFVCGFLLLLTRPFEVGQKIRLLKSKSSDGFVTGLVKSIDAKYVIIVAQEDGQDLEIKVPSSDVYAQSIVIYPSTTTTTTTTEKKE